MKYKLFYSSIFFGIIFISSIDCYSQWKPIGANRGIDALTVIGNKLFMAWGGIFLSTDNGTSWTAVDSGLIRPYTNDNVISLVASGTNLFAGTNRGAFLSTNYGTSWTASGLMINHVSVLAVSGTNLYAGTWGGFFISTDNGTSWTAANSGLTDNGTWAIAVNGNNIFAGTQYSGIYRSTNNGTNWSLANTGLTNTYVYALAVLDTNIFASTEGGVFRSTNNGTSWTAVNSGLNDLNIKSLAVFGNNLFAGGYNGGHVFLSTNKGTNWTAVNSGLSYIDVINFAVCGNNLFAGGQQGVWWRPMSEMLTSVEQTSSQLPERFILFQNYPNPFNPTTTISFSIPSKSFVSLRIFDELGREISVLISEELNVGTYSRKMNAADLPSGVYFYRLQAGSFTATKKLVLLR